MSRIKSRTYRAPGRINLIGEHTDYNSGYVLPGSVDMHLTFEVAPGEGDLFEFHSLHFDELDTCDIQGKGLHRKWSVFFGQVIQLMHDKGYPIAPVTCSFDGNLPIGAGMSSSSALTCGLIYALNDLYDIGLTQLDMVFLASEAERGSGLDGGKMDQYSILMGMDDTLLLLDCQAYKHQNIKVNLGDHVIVLLDTRVSHELLDSGYNDRHADCKRGLQQLKAKYPELNSVRDIVPEILIDGSSLMDKVSLQRLTYVLDENKRVLDVANALKGDDVQEVGRLLYESHKGLRTQYGVSCAELDYIVEWSKGYDEIAGARMMGGGFGGCVIALMEKTEVANLFAQLQLQYRKVFGHDHALYHIQLSRGVHRLS